MIYHKLSGARKLVAFICYGNSCRSIMAEALARHFHGNLLQACSAGLRPLGYIVRETLLVLAEEGISTSGLWSKGVEDIDWERCVAVVNLSEHSLAGRLPPENTLRVIHRPVTDPFGRSLAVYRQTREAIRRLLAQEAAGWLA